MKIQIQAYHEVNGTRTDIYGFNYSDGIVQTCIKNVEFEGVNKEQSITEENDDSYSYKLYGYDENRHLFSFQIQSTEQDFFLSLAYHSHVSITFEDGQKFNLKNTIVSIDKISEIIYIAQLQAMTEDSVMYIRGNVL